MHVSSTDSCNVEAEYPEGSEEPVVPPAIASRAAESRLTGAGEDPHHQADPPVPQQDHVCVVGLHPALVPLGFNRGPDADPQNQQVEHEGGHQPRDVQSHPVWIRAGSRLEAWTATGRGSSQRHQPEPAEQ